MNGYYFSGFSDDELRTIYVEEYLPWTKTGILQNGKLRNILNSLEKDDSLALIMVEKMFINECARRFANVGHKSE